MGGRRLLSSVGGSILLVTSLAVTVHAQDSGTSRQSNQIDINVTGGAIGSLSTSPLALTPTFARGITDYVLRCQSGTNTLRVTLAAVAGGTLRIGDSRGLSLTIDEDLLENQALVISSPWSQVLVDASHVSRDQDEQREEQRGHTEYWIRCLPHDFPQLTVARPGNAPLGWYLTGNINVGGARPPMRWCWTTTVRPCGTNVYWAEAYGM